MRDISIDGKESAARNIVAQGGIAEFIADDVADEGSVAALIETTMTKYGRLDGSFNNAGTGKWRRDCCR